MKSVFNNPIQIGAAIYGLFYFFQFALPVILGTYSSNNFENISVLSMFILYFIGFIFSLFRGKVGGLVFQIWFLFIWILGFYFWPDADIAIALAVPVLLMGIFIYQNTHKKTHEKTLTKPQIRDHLLKVLMINYGILYAAVAIPTLIQDFNMFTKMPMIIFPLLFIIFVFSFALSWKKKLTAGILLVLWYLIVFTSSLLYGEFANEAPSILMGLTLFIQAILYILYDKKHVEPKIISA